jgi:uncharacterized membrane protein YoaK (UPF0700 family)
MHAPIEFLRGLIGFIGIGCAYMAGRSTVAVRKGWQKPSRLTGWILRTVLCLLAVVFRHPLDFADVAVVALAAVAFSAGVWNTSHEKKEEDLSHTIFPHDP